MRDKTGTRGVRRVLAFTILVLAAALAGSGSVSATPPELADDPLLQPIDAQNWVDQGELTWADYRPVPDARPEFYDGSADGSQSQYRRRSS